MAKRKSEDRKEPQSAKKAKGYDGAPMAASNGPLTIQVVVGSYDRVLHGVTATMDSKDAEARFADTFLFDAHSSAIRCLALSPPSAPAPGQAQKVMLATGSTDERVHVFQLSAHPPRPPPPPPPPPPPQQTQNPPTTADKEKAGEEAEADAAGLLVGLRRAPIVEDRRNRALGTLLHHAASVTRLAFPTRGKLLSAAEDSTIAVSRTRDWALLSTIRAPVPKALGRPSGDTAAYGGVPAGVNDFAVHPSRKLMISVGRGERCMRLWNLVTGRKAGVLNFGRDVLVEAGEGRHTTGEARRVAWGSNSSSSSSSSSNGPGKGEGEGDDGGATSAAGEDEFAVGFDRNVIVFGMDSRPRCKVMPDATVKVHEFCYVRVGGSDGGGEATTTVLAVATEDGRILFYSTRPEDLQPAPEGTTTTGGLPRAKLISQLGGTQAGVSGRIKDFAVLPVAGQEHEGGHWIVVSGSSDGAVRVWTLAAEDFSLTAADETGKQVGHMRGCYETQNRITCLGAFVMIPRPDDVEDSEEEEEEAEEEDGRDSEGDE